MNESIDNDCPVKSPRPCSKCGCKWVKIVEKSGHQTAWCDFCQSFVMNVPKSWLGLKTRSLKTTHEAITGATRKQVLMRSGGRCELCGRRGEQLQIGHLVSVEAGHRHGLTDAEINHPENLCGLCAECNSNIRSDVVPLRIAIVMIRDRAAVNTGQN